MIDADRFFLRSLSALVESMGLTCHEFDSGEAFFRQFDFDVPGCLISEMSLPDLSGLQILERLATAPVALPVILVTSQADVDAVMRAKRMGATDFLLKHSFSDNELCEAIDAALARDLANRQAYNRQKTIQASLAELSPIDRGLLELLLSGKSTQWIADELGESRRAIESRRTRLMRKLGASTLPDLVRFGIEAGLYRPAGDKSGS